MVMKELLNKPIGKLLLVSDFVKHSGFARVGEALAKELMLLGWDVAVMAINYRGDYAPQQQSYRLYPAATADNADDLIGMTRLPGLVEHEQPDVILVIGDPWTTRAYLPGLAEMADAPPAVLYTPVDATSLRPTDVRPLNGYHQVVAYTAFGKQELIRAGLRAPCHIIPHGIDLQVFRPVDQAGARALTGLPPDTFAVLVLDRNQIRKRLDIAFDAFAMFARNKPDNVKLVYHGALNDAGWDIEDMARDLGIEGRMIYTRRDLKPLAGVPIEQMKVVYSMCDVKVSATSGEGWGLTTMEALACGLCNIVPDFAALGEWARDAVWLVPASTPLRHALINTVGMAPRAESVADALDYVYTGAPSLREAGLELVSRPEYRWSAVAQAFDQVLTCAAAHDIPVELDARPQTEVLHA
jgi:D-inositol-3-phosphate glycosyltransferase